MSVMPADSPESMILFAGLLACAVVFFVTFVVRLVRAIRIYLEIRKLRKILIAIAKENHE